MASLKTDAALNQLIRYVEDVSCISDNLTYLTKRFPNMWIAVYNGEYVTAKTDEDLLEKLGDRAMYAAKRFLRYSPGISVCS